MSRRIVLYDGECGFCTGAVQFIIKHDRTERFRFASLQSEPGRELCEQCGLEPGAFDTMVLIENGRAFTESEAVVRVARRLDGIWKLGAIWWLIPRPLRQWQYRLVARHRHRWFRSHPECWVPDARLRRRFMEFDDRQSRARI